ncbi:2-phosphosulfolactate phosphatase [Mycobacterium sp. URHB0044]|uniref:2-phosphosulfolactate phosphatase n=1 Tax=Mycobacterium sp. URHB0044 TaxID=1380386 RepID=UPI00350FD2B9
MVDVLSFTTAVSVAADKGIDVYPYRWQDRESALRFASDRDAVLAVGRSRAASGDVTLSPESIRHAGFIARLVLPSPNGSTIAVTLGAAHGPQVVAGCLRNTRAVAEWIGRHLPRHATIAVIAAGEIRSDASLSPAVEDLWGAGALIELLAADGRSISPESGAALAAWSAVAPSVQTLLIDCVSGRELSELGFETDVSVAAELDQSRSVPVLQGDCFVAE